MADVLQKQRGFTALELAVVIIVLGVLFGMVLKGRVAIEVMHGVATLHQLQDFQNKIQQYVAEYHELPGDDPAAVARFGRTPTVTMVGGFAVSAAGDGIIQGDLSDSLNPEGEELVLWRDLRFAGILDGDPALIGQAAKPENYFGDIFGVAEENFGLEQVLCAAKIPGRVAQYIDEKLDDGNIATGRVRATSRWDPVNAKNHFAAPDTSPYDPNKTYIICMPLVP